MQGLSRTRALKIAAVIAVVVAIFAIVTYDLPGLSGGVDQFLDPYPYGIILGSFASDVLALVAAYGAWNGKKWGAVLLIFVQLYWLIQAVSGLIIATDTFALAFAAVSLILHLVVTALCLWRERTLA